MIPKSGYASETADRFTSVDLLKQAMVEIPRFYHVISYDNLKNRKPGKWSNKEVLGHLIDSALNNLRRFTEAQFSPQPYNIIPYQQEQLIPVNHYQDLPLDHLLQLWTSLNQQIIFVIENMPADKCLIPVTAQYDDGVERTLEWLFNDYVAHMYHHWDSIKISTT